MSVFSRAVLAGLACASIVVVQAAPTAAMAQAGDDPNASTGARLGHATKCLFTMGFGCSDKAAGAAKSRAADHEAAKGADPAKASEPPGTRVRFMQASRCVMTLGFSGRCDKNDPAEVPKTDAPDTSTRGRFFQAAKCVTSFGLRSGCDKGDAH